MKSLKLSFFLIAIFGIFVASSCQQGEEDPCYGIMCFNDGFCLNGECDCPEGFTGPSCLGEIVPTLVRINSITVTRFPDKTTSGESWDIDSGCDIYPTIEINGTTVYMSNDFIINAVQNTIYTFPLTDVVLYNVQDRYVIKLMDYDDLDADDYIGGIEFTPYLPGIGFQENIILGQTLPISFTLNVTYIF